MMRSSAARESKSPRPIAALAKAFTPVSRTLISTEAMVARPAPLPTSWAHLLPAILPMVLSAASLALSKAILRSALLPSCTALLTPPTMPVVVAAAAAAAGPPNKRPVAPPNLDDTQA